MPDSLRGPPGPVLHILSPFSRGGLMNSDSKKPDPEDQEGPRGEPLDLEKARQRIELAEELLEGVSWPPFFALEESAANSLVKVALHNLDRARSRLDLEEARRIQAHGAGDLDERPLLSVLDPHPEPPDDWDPLGLKEKKPRWFSIRPMFTVFAAVGFILSCLLLVLWEGGVIGW